MAPVMMLKPTAPVFSSAKSSFSGVTASFQNLSIAPSAGGRSYKLDVQGKILDLWCMQRAGQEKHVYCTI